MSKINTKVRKSARTGVIATTGEAIVNFDGLPAFERDAKSELFLAGVGAFYGEQKFYATGDEEAARFRGLVQTVAKQDPEWVAAFLPWLRHKANIRTAALVGACEYVASGAPNGRRVINSVISRADEPGEVIAYWLSTRGRNIPQPVKRGVRDAATRLYSEATVAKWDSAKSGVRFADVVELTHPEPTSTRQSDLFRFLIEDRHGRATFEGKDLPWLQERHDALRSEDPRAALLGALVSDNRTVTWESVSAAGEGKMAAEQWTTLYEHMGYMARLRNLRNLDEAGVSTEAKREIAAKLADPAEVANSKQLPMRFLSAYNAVPSLVWGEYLSEALDHSLANVPTIPGKWLVLVDASGSMGAEYGRRGEASYYANACVFAAAFAKANDARLFTYSNQLSREFPQVKGESTLATVKRLAGRDYWFGGGTATAEALEAAFKQGEFDRILLLTDEIYNGGNTYWGYSRNPSEVVPASTPLYVFNLAGYKAAQQEAGLNRITVGGLSDSAFSMIASVEQARGGTWPFSVG